MNIAVNSPDQPTYTSYSIFIDGSFFHLVWTVHCDVLFLAPIFLQKKYTSNNLG